MRKNASLVISFLAAVLFLAALFSRQGNGVSMPQVGAARLNSSFSSPENISNSAAGGDASIRVRAALGPDGYLHAGWQEGELNVANGPAYIMGQQSAWPQWEMVGPANNRGYVNPAVAVDNNNGIHLVWAGDNGPPYKIFYVYKPAGGSWTTPVSLSDGLGNSVFATIDTDSQNRVWVVWETEVAEGQFEIYARSKPAGGDWTPQVVISNQPGMELEPDIAVDANGVPHVVWRSNQSQPNWEIYHTKYVAGSWTTPFNVSANTSASHFARMAANQLGDVFVVWEDEIDGSDRFQTLFRRWDGSQWGSVKRVSATPEKALYPSIGADGCNLYSAWTDYRSSPTDIFFSYSTNCGETWSDDESVYPGSSGASFFPSVVAQAGGYAHIFWQEELYSARYDIYYSKATVAGIITPTPSHTPTLTPTATHTPSPTNTPIPHPYGWVQVVARQPSGNTEYTRLLNVDLSFDANSPGGNPLQMRYANQNNFQDHPDWETYNSWVSNWPFTDTTSCEPKWIFAQFKDTVTQLESPIYSDYIFYDDYLVAGMSLNEDKPYTNRLQVMVNSEDLDLSSGCSGLEAMAVWEEGLTQTVWINYFPRLYFFLAPQGPPVRTIHVRYRDRAGNEGTYADSIQFDLIPPYGGTAPILNNGISPTNQLQIPVSGLEAFDDESGVGNVWFSNRPDGPWLDMPYVVPPHDYIWNLAYGGPPILSPDLHYVFVKYEDDSGYGSFPGNFSETFSGKILINNISNIYLPVVLNSYDGLAYAPAAVDSAEVDLVLLADPQQAHLGEDVLLWLAAQREQEQPLRGTMQLALPDGLRVLQAWSAYGQLLQVEDHLVVSQERTSSRLTPWILVQARVEEAGVTLQTRGVMSWTGGGAVTPLIHIETR